MSSTPSTRSRTITIKGLEEVTKRLDIDVLAQPEFDAALATFQKRIERPSKGLGAKRNTLAATTQPLSIATTSTLVYPRTTGEAWARKMQSAITAMAPNVVRKAVRNIEARWAGEATSAVSE